MRRSPTSRRRPARDEMAQRRHGRRPQAERAVDVHPGAVPVGELDRLGERIERAGVQVAGLQADDDRARPRRAARAPRRVRRRGSGPGRRRRPARGAETEVAQGEIDGVVPLGADQHVDAGRAGQAVAAHVPSGPWQHRGAAGGQPGEVRHRGAGDEADVGAGRQPEQVEQPRPAASSTAAAAGVANRMPVFWSHALTSQSAARAAGKLPPITQPKNRPDGIAISPGSTGGELVDDIRGVAAGGRQGLPNTDASSSAPTLGATRR